ncbi:MAG TPA: TlpA disulfide reductase family protein [Pyrinomonadaceae bacterium]|nr:TlpA disulfide reductase family protein [Pyrinomonadaceae bacterium]
MREIFKYLLFFAVLAVALPGLTACGDTTNGTGAGNSQPGAEPGTSSSEYPPFNSVAANAEMRHLDGSNSTVAQRGGKVVLVNMWATWCGPCREEMPELVKMQNEHGEKGFEVIGLNVDDEPEDMVREFVTEMNLNYTITWGNEEMITALMRLSRSEAIPQSFLIDREGNLRGVFKGASPREITKMKENVDKVVEGLPTTAEPADTAQAAEQTQPANK